VSASEKLKRPQRLMYEVYEGRDRVASVDILPQIVAVVEAAEAAMQTETVSALDEDDYTVWYDRPADREPLRVALAALEEALQ